MSAKSESLKAEMEEALTDKHYYTAGRRGRASKDGEARFNRQLFGDEDQVDVRTDLSDSGRELYNAKEPNLKIIHEKPEHRVIAFMKAQGANAMQIYKHLGGEVDSNNRPVSGTGRYSYAWITQILRQPWFRTRVLQEIENSGRDKVEAILSVEVLRNLEVMTEIRDNPEAKASDRLRAADSLTDRFLGKPTQHIKTESKVSYEKLENEVDELDNEIANLQRQLK